VKVYIVTDLEGVSGVIGAPASGQPGNQIVNPEVAARLLVGEVNAAVEGALRGGATEVAVLDGHGGSRWIPIEDLHPEAYLIQGVPGPVSPFETERYEAVFQIGAHAMMGTPNAFLHHTFNSHAIVNMWLNGEKIGEIGIVSLLAGYYDMPVVLVSGDRAACEEAEAFLGRVETVVTKIGLSRYRAKNRPPYKVRAELREKAEFALHHLTEFQPRKIPPPYELRIQYMCPNTVEEAVRRGAKRIDAQTVAYEGQDFIEVWSKR